MSSITNVPDVLFQTPAVTAGAKNILSGGTANTLASGADVCSIFGGGTITYPNVINGTNPSLCLILGGYDNTNTGELANGILNGMHSTIQATTTHCTIVGGSTLVIASGADYALAAGGLSNTVSGDYAGAYSGNNNNVSGVRSVAIGGNSNTISGDQSVGLAGNNNTGSGQYSLVSGVNSAATATGAVALGTNAKNYSVSGGILGGDSNTLGNVSTANRGDYSGMLGGLSNTVGGSASARFSGVVGSRSSTIDAEYCAIVGGREMALATEFYQAGFGYQGSGVWFGAVTHAAGKFSTAGDAQYVRAVGRNTTTNNSSTPLWLDGATKQLALADNTTWTFSAIVVGRRTDASDNAGYRVEGVITRGSGAASTAVASVTTTVLYESDSTWDATAIANTTAGSLRIQVTGATGKTVKWFGAIHMAQVTG